MWLFVVQVPRQDVPHNTSIHANNRCFGHDGIDTTPAEMSEFLSVASAKAPMEIAAIQKYCAHFGDCLLAELREDLQKLEMRVQMRGEWEKEMCDMGKLGNMHLALGTDKEDAELYELMVKDRLFLFA